MKRFKFRLISSCDAHSTILHAVQFCYNRNMELRHCQAALRNGSVRAAIGFTPGECVGTE